MAPETATIGLETPLVRVLGGRTANQLKESLKYETCGELLMHFPSRYVRLGELTPISDLERGAEVTIVARVLSKERHQMRSRRGFRLEVVVADAHGPEASRLRMTFFNAYAADRELKKDAMAMFSGRITEYREKLELTHPKYALLDDPGEAGARLYPIYPVSGKATSDKILASVGTVLDVLDDEALVDPIPRDVLARRRLPGLAEALRAIHAPADDEDWARARRRFRYEEALLVQAALAERRRELASEAAVPRPPRPGGLLERFDAALPFELTEGQRAAGKQLGADLSRDSPANRLLQGDVGSGKTVVALRAMLQVVDAGGQAALLAPTEVLAQQHLASIRRLLGPLADRGLLGGDPDGTRVDLLTGSLSTARRREVLLRVASGETGIVVGTHALLGEHVQFADLGLVVVDEQHRFGVEQRDTLRSRGDTGLFPHMLVMTATPIPRTVAMTTFGDLETSVLAGLPAGRAPIRTHLAWLDRPKYERRVFGLIREEADAGHQVYVVCPRIDAGDDGTGGTDGDAGGAPGAGDADGGAAAGDRGAAGRAALPPKTAVETMAGTLRGHPDLSGVRIGVLHGRMAPEEKAAAMAAFESGETQVLVSTTVVEVGVDVPNATLMVVVDAESFGISQLHQLRGRIGRGGLHGTCLLATRLDEGHPSVARLRAVAATTDGFELANADLEERREGDVLGASQSGRRSSLRLLRVSRDAATIERAREDAAGLVAADGGLAAHPALLRAVEARLAGDTQAFLERG